MSENIYDLLTYEQLEKCTMYMVTTYFDSDFDNDNNYEEFLSLVFTALFMFQMMKNALFHFIMMHFTTNSSENGDMIILEPPILDSGYHPLNVGKCYVKLKSSFTCAYDSSCHYEEPWSLLLKLKHIKYNKSIHDEDGKVRDDDKNDRHVSTVLIDYTTMVHMHVCKLQGKQVELKNNRANMQNYCIV